MTMKQVLKEGGQDRDMRWLPSSWLTCRDQETYVGDIFVRIAGSPIMTEIYY